MAKTTIHEIFTQIKEQVEEKKFASFDLPTDMNYDWAELDESMDEAGLWYGWCESPEPNKVELYVALEEP